MLLGKLLKMIVKNTKEPFQERVSMIGILQDRGVYSGILVDAVLP